VEISEFTKQFEEFCSLNEYNLKSISIRLYGRKAAKVTIYLKEVGEEDA
jgi:hypothetical protein